MEIQTSDSKKVFKVFDAAKRRRSRKKREGADDSNSIATDESNHAGTTIVRVISGKSSLRNVPADTGDGHLNSDSAARNEGSSQSVSREEHRSPRHHKRLIREGLSLALKAGMVSTPRLVSPSTGGDAGAEAPVQDHDSFIYAFLEEAIKRDKKKRHHGRRHEERRSSRDRDRDASESHDHRHRHRRRRDDLPTRDKEKHRKEESPPPAVNQAALLETFAKLCAKMNETTDDGPNITTNHNNPVQCTQSHKSLQCEVASRRDINYERRPEPPVSHENTLGDVTPTRIRSQANCRSRDKVPDNYRYKPEPKPDYDKEKYDRFDCEKYCSKIDLNQSRVIVNRVHEEERYRGYRPEKVSTRTCIIGSYRDRQRDRDYREYDRRPCEDGRRRYLEQKTSRSFEMHRDGYEEDRCRRTSRSDTKDRRYDDKYYEKPMEAPRHFHKDRSRRPADRYDRNSVASREDEYRERDRYSERERDSGLSVADGETSTVSGRTGKSHYMRAVKQEIAEQREAMDKMMKLWQDLMRCFKGISNTQDKEKAINENACENVRESAAAQLRLWRECMRRYETVARDVGDTDARLMEEITKQRSEMSEMATMWQECLQRYRDMSNDFNTLKQKLATAESPTRLPAAGAGAGAGAGVGTAGGGAPLAEGEGPPLAAHYRLPHTYPQGPVAGYEGAMLRGRASVPPAWWWGGERSAPRARSSRRSSPDSRDARGSPARTTRRHKDDRDGHRYKEKLSKASAPRSEHRRRKR